MNALDAAQNPHSATSFALPRTAHALQPLVSPLEHLCAWTCEEAWVTVIYGYLIQCQHWGILPQTDLGFLRQQTGNAVG